MICPKCKATLPDGVKFCTVCGEPIQAQATAPASGLSAKERGLKKKEFIANEASAKAKNASKFAYFAFLAAAILMVVCVIVTNSTPFYDLPIFALVLEKDDIEDFKDDLDKSLDLIDDAEEMLEDIEDELDDDDYKILENYIDTVRDTVKSPSLTSFRGILTSYESLDDIDVDEDLEDVIDFGYMEDVTELAAIFDAVIIAGYIFAAIIILLALLSAHFKRTGVAILAAIIAAPYTLILSGVIWFVLITAALIVLAVMCTTVNKEYKGK